MSTHLYHYAHFVYHYAFGESALVEILFLVLYLGKSALVEIFLFLSLLVWGVGAGGDYFAFFLIHLLYWHESTITDAAGALHTGAVSTNNEFFLL